MEIAGIPTVTMGYADQINFFDNTVLINGCPGARWIDVPRYGSGEERVATFYDKIEEALTSPITAEEKQSGLYQPPAPPRIAFEGTLDEAQEFFQQTTLVENCRNCPIAKYTDGMPIIIPTEEKVAEMLTGTSHDPNEQVATQYDIAGWGGVTPAGSPIIYCRTYTTTVEKAAVCAVMAGCKPEFLPVALAIATAGGSITSCPGTSGPGGVGAFCVSGPIAKEIGMNAGQNALDVGNQANTTLGRFAALISINAGGAITGLVRTDSGNPIHSLCFAEDIDGLPPGWRGLNEESTYIKDGENVNYTKDESVVGRVGYRWALVGNLHSPGSTRQLPEGYGGFARYIQNRLGLPEGTPIYNWLDGYVPVMTQAVGRPGGRTFIMDPYMALMLYDAGFKDKVEAYQYLVDNFFITAYYYSTSGWWDFVTDAGRRTESTSGKTYGWLAENDPDYPIPAFGNNPMSICFIVSAGFADELCHIWEGGRPSAYPIDPWR
jgi:hypothetical protein